MTVLENLEMGAYIERDGGRVHEAERGPGPHHGRPGYVLELRRNRFKGSGATLLADPDVKRLYLGG